MLWVKSLHVIFMVTWFAGLFYLPRVFVYHAQAAPEETAVRETFKVMERKLLGITNLGMLLTLVFGVALVALVPGWMAQTWLQLKLVLVAGLIAYHFWCARIVRTFRGDANARSHVWYRWFNEIPVAFLFGIVVLVIVKPFGG